MSCYDTCLIIGLRAFGFGERGLPRADIDLCQQVVLIGSGVLWNLYYMIIALCFGFSLPCFWRWGKTNAIVYSRAGERLRLSVSWHTLVYSVFLCL